MWERIAVILRKELLQTMREPRMRVLVLVPPLIQLVVFGYAVSLDVNLAKLAWMDSDRSPASRELMREFTGSNRFEIVAYPSRDDEAADWLDRGRAQAVVHVPAGFDTAIRRGATAQIQILVDGSNSNTASIVAGYAAQVAARFSSSIRVERLRELRAAQSEPYTPAIPAIAPQPRVWFNPDLESRNYFVPGVLVNILMVVTVMLTSMGIVREKEIGTMEQLMVTPIRPIELMIGKALPFAGVGMLNLTLITIVARLVFHVPIEGSLLLLGFCAALFLMTALGAGLFVSTVSATQQQAMLSSFLFFMPAFMLSGFAFPVRNMPLPAQYLSRLNPLRYFLEIVRGLFLKGSGIAELWPQMVVLAVSGILILGASALRFRKQLD
jgi:ABC-2 type transport system permease protein